MKKKYDGSNKIQTQLYFDDFISDVNYFNDVSLKKTIYFFIKNKESIDNKLSKLSSLLFTIDDDSMLYFQKKTIIGFMLVSDNYYNFLNLLENEKSRTYNSIINTSMKMLKLKKTGQ